MKKIIPIITATLLLICCQSVSVAANSAEAELAYKESQAVEAKAFKAIVEYSQTAEDLPELTSLQVEALEISEKLKALNQHQLENCTADPAWTVNAEKIKETQGHLAELKKTGKAETDEAKGLSEKLTVLGKEKARIQKAYAEPQISALNAKKGQLLDKMFHLTVTESTKAKSLVDAYVLAVSANKKALKTWAEAQGKILPVDYITSFEPKPCFKPGHTLPPLTRFGWASPFEARKAFADDWGYAVELGGYTSMKVVERIKNPFSDEAKSVALVNSNPEKYKLSVTCDRYTPVAWSSDIWCRDANGKFLNAKAVSMDGTEWNPSMHTTYRLTTPDDYWVELGRGRAKPLEELRKLVPISIVLNGGEYGMGIWGFCGKVWQLDPADSKFLADQKANGVDEIEASHLKKVHSEELTSSEVKKAVPDRLLYIFYTLGGNPTKGYQADWREWGGLYKDARGKFSDLPSNEHYLSGVSFNTGFLGEKDLLSKSLNAIGEQVAMGDNIAYSWFWLDEKNMPEDYLRYRGLLKCYYVTGVIGGNAGTYNTPDFVSPFDPKKPPNWIVQQMELGKVHALFSHLEDYIRNGDLVDDGKYKAFWWPQQPSYELLPDEIQGGAVEKEADGKKVVTLIPGRPIRVLARKHRQKDEWLVAAWAADGQPHPATVTIPGAGRITLQARAGGSTYLVKIEAGKPVAQLLDPDEEDPSGGFRKLTKS